MARRQSGGSASTSVAPPPFAHRRWGLSDARRAGGLNRTYRILAKMLRHRGNSEVTTKRCRIRFVFLVMANTCAIGRWVSYWKGWVRAEWRPIPRYPRCPAQKPKKVRQQLSSPKQLPCLGLPFCNNASISSHPTYLLGRGCGPD
jgi:hypothetical protein